MFFMTTPARLFKGAVIANFVLHASLDGLMAGETFFIREIPSIIMTFYTVIRKFVSLVSLRKFIRRDHDVEFFGDGYLLSQEIALCSHTAHEQGGYQNPYPPRHRLVFLRYLSNKNGFVG
jgi:hypothetical protein